MYEMEEPRLAYRTRLPVARRPSIASRPPGPGTRM